MLSIIKDKISQIWLDYDFRRAERYLKSLGYSDINPDMKDKSIIFSFDRGRVAILNMNHDTLGYSIEATVVFSAEILSLKTNSDMSNLIFMYCCSSSGIRPASESRVRMNISYHIGDKLKFSSLKLGMIYMLKCLATLELYLTERLARLDKDVYDLSMFEDLDLTGFNPQDMGERKEFIFGSWDAYSSFVKEEYAGFPNSPYAVDILAKIKACQDFEEINKIPVSEIGIKLLDDIILNRQLIEVSKTSFGIN